MLVFSENVISLTNKIKRVVVLNIVTIEICVKHSKMSIIFLGREDN